MTFGRRICFSCTDADKRTVTLYKDRYHDHILAEHPELVRDYDYPAQIIEHAVQNAERRLAGQGKAQIYVSRPLQANPPAGAQRVYVVTLPEKSGKSWWVVTAYAEPIV
jgi:hypothetical protein